MFTFPNYCEYALLNIVCFGGRCCLWSTWIISMNSPVCYMVFSLSTKYGTHLGFCKDISTYRLSKKCWNLHRTLVKSGWVVHAHPRKLFKVFLGELRPKVDIWSLVFLCSFMLTWKIPFSGSDLTNTKQTEIIWMVIVRTSL